MDVAPSSTKPDGRICSVTGTVVARSVVSLSASQPNKLIFTAPGCSSAGSKQVVPSVPSTTLYVSSHCVNCTTLCNVFQAPSNTNFTETNAIWSEAMISRSNTSIFCCFTKTFIIRFSPRSTHHFQNHIPNNRLYTGFFADSHCKNAFRRTSS